jgi:serine phosphatase RsbU (regulator of sigma subunit)
MLGIALLNEIVIKQEVMSASDVLNELRIQIKNSLQQTGQSGEQQEGLDIAFCAINNTNFELSFSGAYNPCFIVRNQQELIILEADRQPVGIYIKEKQFSENKIQLIKNDIIYLFSDGYASQLDSTNNETFKIKRLKDLVLNICSKNLTEQKIILETKFNEWRNDREQTDDVLILGVKI